MITKEEAQRMVGTGKRVKSNIDFSGVPKGTEGILDEDYGTGVMVAWDLIEQPLAKGYRVYDKKPSILSWILRDGFGWDELKYLDIV